MSYYFLIAILSWAWTRLTRSAAAPSKNISHMLPLLSQSIVLQHWLYATDSPPHMGSHRSMDASLKLSSFETTVLYTLSRYVLSKTEYWIHWVWPDARDSATLACLCLVITYGLPRHHW